MRLDDTKQVCYIPPHMNTSQLLAQIKAAMHARNISASEVAAAIGTSDQQVGRWLNERHAPAVDSLEALARAVGLEVCLREVERP